MPGLTRSVGARNLLKAAEKTVNNVNKAAIQVNKAATSAVNNMKKLVRQNGSRKLPTGGKRRGRKATRKAGRKSRSTRRR
jgi:hypothetical protein